MRFLIQNWFFILIGIYGLYTVIKNAIEVNKNRPGIPENQPDIKPEAKKRVQVDRPNPTAIPIPRSIQTVPAAKPKPIAPKKEKSFEEAMGEIFSQYENKQGEGYGDSRPFTYNTEEAQLIAEPAKDYKFGDSLVGSIIDRPKPKTMALRGEIGSEDETPNKRRLNFSPKDAVKYSILLERKYFEV